MKTKKNNTKTETPKAGTAQPPKYQILNVVDLEPTKDNPRTVDTKSQAFADLVASVKGEGVRVPVVVRPMPDKKGWYDLRAGARRLAACKAAGIETIPALVYEDMNDQEAYDITFTENFARADLTPMEESLAVARLLERYNNDVAAVAAKVGKSERWVYLRARVHDKLSPEWKKELANPDSRLASEWSIGHFELIARFDRGQQQQLLDEFKYDCAMSVSELEKECEKNLHQMSDALFPQDYQCSHPGNKSKKLVVCGNCRERTSVNPMLWQEEGATAANPDRCLNHRCWGEKTVAYVKEKVAELSKEHKGLRFAVDTDHVPSYIYNAGIQILRKWEIKPSKAGADKSFPCYMLTGKSAGKVAWKCRTHDGNITRQGNPKVQTGKKSMEDKRKGLGRKRYCHCIEQLRELLTAMPLDKVACEDKAGAVMWLAMCFGVPNAMSANPWEIARRAFMNMDQTDAVEKLWDEVKDEMAKALRWSGPVTQLPDRLIDAAETICGLVSVEINDLMNAAAEAIPEPKSWAKANDAE